MSDAVESGAPPFAAADPAAGTSVAHDALGYRVLCSIRRIIRQVTTHSRHLASETGLTVPQLLCLRAIEDLGDGATSGRITQVVQLSPSTVSGIVDRLVRAGLVTRERSERDRRVQILGLTELGRSRLIEMPRPLQERFLVRLASLDPDERERILAAIEKVVELMDATELDASPVLVDGEDLRSRE